MAFKFLFCQCSPDIPPQLSYINFPNDRRHAMWRSPLPPHGFLGNNRRERIQINDGTRESRLDGNHVIWNDVCVLLAVRCGLGLSRWNQGPGNETSQKRKGNDVKTRPLSPRFYLSCSIFFRSTFYCCALHCYYQESSLCSTHHCCNYLLELPVQTACINSYEVKGSVSLNFRSCINEQLPANTATVDLN